MVRPPPLPHKSQVKNESPNALFPPFGLLIPTLKDQWPRLDLDELRQRCKNTPLSLVTQVKRFFMSLRDEAKVKMKCTCPEQDNKAKYGSFQVQNDVSASIRQ
jgi:hypothetical protein